MDIGQIEKFLETCDLRELYTVEAKLTDLIKKAKQHTALMEDTQARQLRREERFETTLSGSLIRVTDVKPGERKEYSITIQDLSRSGMKFKVDTTFIPSRVVEVLFGAPGGKIKQTFMEVVRMKKRTDSGGAWLEVGCRKIGEEAVHRLRLQEKRIAQMRSKLHQRSGLQVLVVGPEIEEVTKLVNRIKNDGYQVRRVDRPKLAVRRAENLGSHLVIYYQGEELCRDPELLKTAVSGPSKLATLALVENEEQQFILFRAGIDECLMLNRCHEFLSNAMERALIGRAIRQNYYTPGQVLVVSKDNTKINLLFYQFEEQGYLCKVERDPQTALEFNSNEYDLVLADYSELSPESFRDLREKFYDLPLIALCDEFASGTQAMAQGANNYLCMPPTPESVQLVLGNCVAKAPVT